MAHAYRPWLIAGVVASIALPAAAQTRTTATYDDWTVRCETIPAVPAQQGAPAQPARKSCEMFQVTQVQGQPNPVTQIAIGRASKTEPLKLVMQVPVNLWLASGVKLVYDEKQPGLSGAFKRCVPVGCFADVDLNDDLVKRMRARTEPGRLEFKDATQRDVAIPVSFKGFGQAYDALLKE
jgi:invasion protein IalB